MRAELDPTASKLGGGNSLDEAGSFGSIEASKNLNITYDLLQESCSAWLEENAPSLGAAMAFYTIFSLAPVLVVAMAVAGLVFGHKAAESEILLQLQALVGERGARAVQMFVQGADRPVLGVAASTIGIGTVLVGASGAFIEFQAALDKIWRVTGRTENVFVGAIRKRFLSFGLVLARASCYWRHSF